MLVCLPSAHQNRHGARPRVSRRSVKFRQIFRPRVGPLALLSPSALGSGPSRYPSTSMAAIEDTNSKKGDKPLLLVPIRAFRETPFPPTFRPAPTRTDEPTCTSFPSSPRLILSSIHFVSPFVSSTSSLQLVPSHRQGSSTCQHASSSSFHDAPHAARPYLQRSPHCGARAEVRRDLPASTAHWHAAATAREGVIWWLGPSEADRGSLAARRRSVDVRRGGANVGEA